jgi:hypothetical protein
MFGVAAFCTLAEPVRTGAYVTRNRKRDHRAQRPAARRTDSGQHQRLFWPSEAKTSPGSGEGRQPVNYDRALDAAIDRLHDEGRYRTFIDIERQKGQFPHAVWTKPDGTKQ